MDRGGHASVLVLFDMRSAFHTVDYAILLEALDKRFGVTGIALKWYCFFVDGRMKTFLVGSKLSATLVIHCSVPRGSVLGALKFVTYTEDLPAVKQRFAIDHHLHADDTRLSDKPQVTSVVASISNMEHCVDAVHAWCSAKQLQLNPSKS